MTLGIYGEVVFDLFYQLVSSLDLFYFSMDLASILSEEELLALLVSIDEKLEKVDSFKRVQLVSLCRTQAKALAHFRNTAHCSTPPESSDGPIVLQVHVSEVTGVGGVVPDDCGALPVSLCERGVGDAPALASTRSVSSQITTTRPATGSSSARRLTRQAPPVRVERHYFHAVGSASGAIDSGQHDIHAEYDSSESEDESEYPLGYFDESEDDCGGTGGHLAFPTFSPSQLEQAPALDTGFQAASYGGVLEASDAEFFPQQNILTGSASTFIEGAEPADVDYDDYSFTHEHSDRSEHDSGGACEDDWLLRFWRHHGSGAGGSGGDSYDGHLHFCSDGRERLIVARSCRCEVDDDC